MLGDWLGARIARTGQWSRVLIPCPGWPERSLKLCSHIPLNIGTLPISAKVMAMLSSDSLAWTNSNIRLAISKSHSWDCAAVTPFLGMTSCSWMNSFLPLHNWAGPGDLLTFKFKHESIKLPKWNSPDWVRISQSGRISYILDIPEEQEASKAHSEFILPLESLWKNNCLRAS